MKVMRVPINTLGDDLFLNRLLSYLNAQFPFQIVNIKPIRKNVFLLQSTWSDTFILKGFPSYHRLMKQERLTADLKDHGFFKTYSFLHYAKNPPLYFNRLYYGHLQHIIPSEDHFTFHGSENQEEGLALLEKFHETTGKFILNYRRDLDKYKIVKKWKERKAAFINNSSLLRFFVKQEVIDEFLTWADWSLTGLANELPLRHESEVILHGDVAHHNFLRSERGELFLIDFDLISIGNPSADYLQYANRILPYLNWSFEGLSNLKGMQRFLSDKGFLYGLIYPTDIFREWNRLVREKNYENPIKVRTVLDYILGQFHERQHFVQEIKKLV
jgi:hypothetical protein